MLKGQVAIVFGALGTAGKAITRTLCERGATVIASARRDEGNQLVIDLTQQGYNAVFKKADICTRNEVIATVDETVAEFGKLDILVNCFSVDRLQWFSRDEEESWDQMLNVNLKGTFYACHAALQPMMSQKSGRIINVTSDSGKVGATMEAVQSSTKAGIIGFSKSLAREVARDNITVNALCMGPTSESAEPPHGITEKGWESFIRLIPMRRCAKPEEVASMVAVLASADAAFVTGQAISVSGGLTMC